METRLAVHHGRAMDAGKGSPVSGTDTTWTGDCSMVLERGARGRWTSKVAPSELQASVSAAAVRRDDDHAMLLATDTNSTRARWLGSQTPDSAAALPFDPTMQMPSRKPCSQSQRTRLFYTVIVEPPQQSISPEHTPFPPLPSALTPSSASAPPAIPTRSRSTAQTVSGSAPC